MKYMSMIKGEDVAEELDKERVRFLLKGCYKEEAVDEIIDGGKWFRLDTPVRVIWTEDDSDEGLMIPMPGFYGVVGE